MRILEEFWHGNIEPTDFDPFSCDEYKDLLQLVSRNEDRIWKTLTEEQKNLFNHYLLCTSEFHAVSDRLLFQNSFKLGARMMLEVMEDSY